MKRKFGVTWRVAVVLVLAFAMLPVFAAPVSAQVPTIALDSDWYISPDTVDVTVTDAAANVQGTTDQEISSTTPNDSATDFYVLHRPKALATTDAEDLLGDLTETAIGENFVTVDSPPPASALFADDVPIAPDQSLTTQPGKPTTLTVTLDTAPGAGYYVTIIITGTDAADSPIYEVVNIVGTGTTATTIYEFKTVAAGGLDATQSPGGSASTYDVTADNKVFVTYDWNDYDTVDITATSTGDVDPITLTLNETDWDTGIFTGSFTLDPSSHTTTQLIAADCDTITVEYDGVFDSAGVDTTGPTLSNPQPYPTTNDPLAEISKVITDAKSGVGATSIVLNVEKDTSPPTVVIPPAEWTYDPVTGKLSFQPGPGMTVTELTDGTWYVKVWASDNLGNAATPEEWSFDVESMPPEILDAVTGWKWHFGEYWWRPINANDRYSIMVVFSEPLDPATVEAADFSVVENTISGIELYAYYNSHPHKWPDPETGPLSTNDFGLVFLNLDIPLLTDATPTVNLVGPVSDLAGNELAADSIVAQDGIAPAITLSCDPAPPIYNQYVTITATASEELSEAYCDGNAMTPDDTKTVWTYKFLWDYGPYDAVDVVVTAHDFTAVEECKWWKHEKWTEQSLVFVEKEYIKLYLDEGWNLISVPKALVNPSLGDVFKGSSVTTVYYWNGTEWEYANYSPISGAWIGILTEIVPGKGYWVWCSPGEFKLRLYLTRPDPLDVPPAYDLVAGWNLIGVTMFDWTEEYGYRYMWDYLASVGGSNPNSNWSVLYWYYPPAQEWLRATPGNFYEVHWWYDAFYNNECPVVLAGYGYWLYLTDSGTLAP